MKFINPYKMFVGCFVPNWLVCRNEISQGAKICYARLALYAGDKGYAFPHQETLAAAIGVKLAQVKRYLKELETHKVIVSQQQGLNRPNVYRFPWHEWMDQEREDIENKGQLINELSGQLKDELAHSSHMSQPIAHIRATEENHPKRIMEERKDFRARARREEKTKDADETTEDPLAQQWQEHLQRQQAHQAPNPPNAIPIRHVDVWGDTDSPERVAAAAERKAQMRAAYEASTTGGN